MHRSVVGGVVLYRFEGLDGIGGVEHAILTRIGGVSRPPYATLNLGHTVGDDPAAVEENHRLALSALGTDVLEVVSPYQVHGSRVGVVGRGHQGTVQPGCDALVTDQVGVVLLLRFADCVPVLFLDPDRKAIGIAHAGWRGVAANIVGATVSALVHQFNCDPGRLWAGIGPAIGSCCYEVDPEVVQAVLVGCPADACIARQSDAKTYLDLPGAVVTQLRATGVGRIEESGICTACKVDEFFSHRLEGGVTGRFGVSMQLTR